MSRIQIPSRLGALVLAIAGASMLTPAAVAQTGGVFDLSWHTIDGGGVTFASGGVFTLGGTIGQFDASEPLTGGQFTLYPGFWPGAVQGPCNVADYDVPFGVLDFSDVFFFLVAFGNMEAAADLAVPFGTFDFSDVFAFLVAFGEGCP
ncbi:MAG: GC-type dockerin domain-anchored protein [Phycisphaerales bacterium]